MIQKKFERKLVLKKTEIQELTKNQEENIKGGGPYSQGCPGNPPADPSSVGCSVWGNLCTYWVCTCDQ